MSYWDDEVDLYILERFSIMSKKDSLWFSDRRVRDHLKDKKLSLQAIASQLQMTEHDVLRSLLKLFKNGDIDYMNLIHVSPVPTSVSRIDHHRIEDKIPCFFAVSHAEPRGIGEEQVEVG